MSRSFSTFSGINGNADADADAKPNAINANANTIDKTTIELLKRVQNPDIISLREHESTKPKIKDEQKDEYIKCLVKWWRDYKSAHSSLNLDLDFTISKKDFNKYIRLLDKRFKFPTKLRNATIIRNLRFMLQDDSIDVVNFYNLLELLTTKNRHHSGVLEIAIMTGPGEFSCRFDCHYCPNQPGIARSYIKEEPAVRRAAQNDFDCVRQINTRISSYLAIGQPGDKGEFIILGGTFSNYSDDYRRQFMRDLYYACNTYYDKADEGRVRMSLEWEKEFNQSISLFKVIGLTVETRPDCIDEAEIKRYIEYGVTRVQLGIQHTDDRILKKINRQCYTKDTIRALTLLKTAGFKVLCHYMPNLPGSTPQKDIDMFNDVIFNQQLICDEWKIYPTSVTTTSDKDIEDVFTVIEKWYNDGSYIPYSYEQLEEVIMYAKANIPKYIRISRIFRDIPVDNIIGGADIPHMRQKLQRKMAANNEYCACIRCREIKNREIEKGRVVYEHESYPAQGGTEFFITANYYPRQDEVLDMDEADQKKIGVLKSYIVGFCRLRIQDSDDALDYMPVLKGAGVIRELHVYGKMVPNYLSKFMTSNTQHRGIGSKLVKIAEELAIKNGKYKMAVISGVGVREFYRRKLNYKLEDNYMTKRLDISVSDNSNKSDFTSYSFIPRCIDIMKTHLSVFIIIYAMIFYLIIKLVYKYMIQ